MQCNYNKDLDKVICPAYARRRPGYLMLENDPNAYPAEETLLGAGIDACLKKFEAGKPEAKHELGRACTSLMPLPDGYCCESSKFIIIKGPRDEKAKGSGCKMDMALMGALDKAFKAGPDSPGMKKLKCTPKTPRSKFCLPEVPPGKPIEVK